MHLYKIMLIDSFENCRDNLPDDHIGSVCSENMQNCSSFQRNGLCESVWKDFGCSNVSDSVKSYCQYSCRYYGVDCSGIYHLLEIVF